MFKTYQSSLQSKAHSGEKHVAEMPEHLPASDTGAPPLRSGHRSEVIGGATSRHVLRQCAKLANNTTCSARIVTARLRIGLGSNSPTSNCHSACPYWRCRADDTLSDGRTTLRPNWTHCQILWERDAPTPLKACFAGSEPAIGAGSPAWLQGGFSRHFHG